MIMIVFQSIPALKNGWILYTEPPEDFSTEMSNKQFLLYLNANGIDYDVCKKLKGRREIYIIMLTILS